MQGSYLPLRLTRYSLTTGKGESDTWRAAGAAAGAAKVAPVKLNAAAAREAILTMMKSRLAIEVLLLEITECNRVKRM